jgi:hypothetical protein
MVISIDGRTIDYILANIKHQKYTQTSSRSSNMAERVHRGRVNI